MVMLSAALFSFVAAVSMPGPQAHAALADTGEVILIPRQQVQPFTGWIFSRSAKSCEVLEKNILDVRTWPTQFDNVKSTKVTKLEGDTEHYEMTLTVAFSPTIKGSITRLGPGHVRFNDAVTRAYSVYTLVPAADGSCLVRYEIVEEKGKDSNWVSVLKSLESRSGDAGNLAAAISSCRGFARPEKAPRIKGDVDNARAALAGQGTVVEIDRSGKWPTYTFRHRVKRPFADIAWAVRHKKAYAEKTTVVKKSEDQGNTAAYTMGGFGGRVSFTTNVTEQTLADGTVIIDERVSGGDIGKNDGGWRWKLVPVEGGVDIELLFTADIVAGSTVMRTMASTDPIARESFMLYIGLAFMSDLVGGPNLPL